MKRIIGRIGSIGKICRKKYLFSFFLFSLIQNLYSNDAVKPEIAKEEIQKESSDKNRKDKLRLGHFGRFHIGAKIGMGLTSIYSGDSKTLFETVLNEQLHYVRGELGGINLSYDLSRDFSGQIEIYFIQKTTKVTGGAGLELTDTIVSLGYGEYIEKFDYIEIPVLARYFFNDFSVFLPSIYGGLAYSLIIDRYWELRIGDGVITEKNEGFSALETRKGVKSIVFGGILQIRTNFGAIEIDLRWGIANQQRKYPCRRDF